MRTFLGMDGKVYSLRKMFIAETRQEAHAYCLSQGATHLRDLMQGSIYSHTYRVERDPFSTRFIVLKSQQEQL